MVAELGKYVSVFLISMVKFIGGPLAGAATHLGYFETVVLTAMGMMTTVMLLTLLGPGMRYWLQQRFGGRYKRFSGRNRRVVKIWQRWGMLGVSFLTPLIFTPIGGALLANAFCKDRQKILLYMLVSALFWSLVLSGLLIGGREVLLP